MYTQYLTEYAYMPYLPYLNQKVIVLSTDYLTYALLPYVSPATLIEGTEPVSKRRMLSGRRHRPEYLTKYFGMPSSVLYGWSHFCEWN